MPDAANVEDMENKRYIPFAMLNALAVAILKHISPKYPKGNV